jgi:hypothetical protein
MKIGDWKAWGCVSLSENGEYVHTGSHECRRVLWCRLEDEFNDSRQIQVRISLWRGWRGGRTASVSLHYMNMDRRLWSFKAQSVAQAIRKANFRLRGRVPCLIRAARRYVYRKQFWGCLYRQGQPVASLFRFDWDLRHDAKAFGPDYVTVFQDHNGKQEIWHYKHSFYGWSGSGLQPSPEHQYWIAA